MSEQPSRSLSGRLGVGSIVFMVVAAAAPLTVIAGVTPVGLAAGNGAAFPTAFAICCGILLLFAVGFCAMTRHVPTAGAFYAYIQRGLGRALGVASAFLALVTYTAVQLAVYGFIGAVVGGLVEHWGGPSVAWWVWSILVVAVVAVLGYRNIELSGRVLGVLLLCEVAIVLVFDAVVIGQGQHLSTALVQPAQIFSGSFGIAIMFAIASFIGFEATAIFRDEARDPQRTIPRATYAALLLIGIFYTLSTWAVVSAWGDEAAVQAAGADPANMVLTTIANVLGPVGGDIAQVLLATSLFACILSFHNVLARYLFALGNAGALHEACGRSHDRHGSPHLASMIQTATALVFVVIFAIAGMDPVAQVFAWMAGTATLGVLTLMTLTCAAVVVFFRRHRVDTRPWHTFVAPLLGLVGLGSCLVLTVSNFPTLIGGSTELATAIGAVPAAAFVLGLVWSRRRGIAAPDPTTTPEAVADAA
jgi:amino acid transporter